MKKIKPKFPNNKISEVFLNFSSPVLDNIGKNASPQEVEKVLRITFSVWNAIVLDSVKGGTKYVSALRSSMIGNPDAASLIEQLILRKKELFPEDYRTIGEYKIIERKGEWSLRVEARDPYSIQ